MASTNLIRLSLLFAILLLVVGKPSAQTNCDLQTPKEIEVCKKTEIQVGPFSGRAIYNSETATVNNHNVELLIYLQGDNVDSVAHAMCQCIEQPAIQCERASPVLVPGESPRTLLFKVRVSINEAVEPRAYPLTLSFLYQGQDVVPVSKPLLYVGITKQDLNKPKVAFETRLTRAPVIYTGVNNTLPLTIVNNYSEYAVNIHSITIESDPSDLIQPQTKTYWDPKIPNQKEELKIPPQGGERPIQIPVTANWLNFTNLLGGFSSPQIVLNVIYDDSHGHPVSFRQNIAVNFRPRDRVLVFAMFLGVLAGALVKLYLQRLQQTGQITRRQVLVFVITTMCIGLVVAVIAMVGKIQIIAFDTTGSYDRPVVIFAIALAGAVGGAQILSMWFKKEIGP